MYIIHHLNSIICQPWNVILLGYTQLSSFTLFLLAVLWWKPCNANCFNCVACVLKKKKVNRKPIPDSEVTIYDALLIFTNVTLTVYFGTGVIITFDFWEGNLQLRFRLKWFIIFQFCVLFPCKFFVCLFILTYSP